MRRCHARFPVPATPRLLLLLALIVCAALGPTAPVSARPDGGCRPPTGGRDYVFSGWWHDEGLLLLHVSNAGYVGRSWVSQEPSAEWPAGENVEHLYVAGPWVGVGAGVPGAPRVSTTTYGAEFLPRLSNPADVIYETAAGAPGGDRLTDDDGDGLVDEDRLDGIDNDADGLVDEDYAAISDQMFARACFDTCSLIYNPPSDPHVPLGLALYERSFVWSDPRVDDAVGVSYEFTNVGTHTLSGVYVGIMADPDVGYDDPNLAPWSDDYVRYDEAVLPSETAPYTPMLVRMAYAYDRAGGLDGTAEGYFAVLVLGHTTDPAGVTAPAEAGVRAYRDYQVSQIPSTDAARYAALSVAGFDPPATSAQDWKFVVSTGPYVIAPGGVVTLDVAYVCGTWLDGLRANAGRIAHVYRGYYDKPRGMQVHWVRGPSGASEWLDGAGRGVGGTSALSAGPCPATTRALVSFTLAEAAHAAVDVYTVSGRRVASLASGRFGAGPHEAVWDVGAGGVPSGVYFVRLTAGDRESVTKLVVSR